MIEYYDNNNYLCVKFDDGTIKKSKFKLGNVRAQKIIKYHSVPRIGGRYRWFVIEKQCIPTYTDSCWGFDTIVYDLGRNSFAYHFDCDGADDLMYGEGHLITEKSKVILL
jgi:hypothetical protein